MNREQGQPEFDLSSSHYMIMLKRLSSVYIQFRVSYSFTIEEYNFFEYGERGYFIVPEFFSFSFLVFAVVK